MAYPPKAATKAAFDEMKANPPAILAKTKRKKGAKAADRQRVAIGLAKARRASGTATKHGKEFSFR